MNALHNPVYKLYLLFLPYVPELIVKLNIELRSEQVRIPLILGKVSLLYKTILKNFVKRNIISSAPLDSVPINNPNVNANLDYEGKVDPFLKDEESVGIIEKTVLHNFKLRCLDFCIELANQIKKRFKFYDLHLNFVSKFTPDIAVSGKIFFRY